MSQHRISPAADTWPVFVSADAALLGLEVQTSHVTPLPLLPGSTHVILWWEEGGFGSLRCCLGARQMWRKSLLCASCSYDRGGGCSPRADLSWPVDWAPPTPSQTGDSSGHYPFPGDLEWCFHLVLGFLDCDPLSSASESCNGNLVPAVVVVAAAGPAGRRKQWRHCNDGKWPGHQLLPSLWQLGG